MVTTIQIKDSTLERLRSLKEYARQSYDELINSLIDDENEEFTEEVLEDIKKSLDEVKKGKGYSIEEVAKEFGVKL